jgi:hypothetical protein
MLYKSVWQLVVWSYAIQDKVLNPQTPRKYTILNGNFVFDLGNFDLCCGIERSHGIKRDLPVLHLCTLVSKNVRRNVLTIAQQNKLSQEQREA